MTMSNPYMDALSSGGKTASATASVASSFGSNAITAMKYAGDIALKMDALLQEAEAQRHNRLMDIQNNITQQVQFDQKMLFDKQKEAFDQYDANRTFDQTATQYEWEQKYKNKVYDQTAEHNRRVLKKQDENNNLLKQNTEYNRFIGLLNVEEKDALNSIDNTYIDLFSKLEEDYSALDTDGNKVIKDPIAYKAKVTELTKQLNADKIKAQTFFTQQRKNFLSESGLVDNKYFNYQSQTLPSPDGQSTYSGNTQAVQAPSTNSFQEISLPGIDIPKEWQPKQTQSLYTPKEITPTPSSYLTQTGGRVTIDSSAPVAVKSFIQSISKKIPFGKATMEAIESLGFNTDSIDSNKITQYNNGQINLADAIGFDSYAAIENGEFGKVATYLSMALNSKSKKDVNSGKENLSTIFKTDAAVGKNIVASVFENASDKQKIELLKEVGDGITRIEVKQLEDVRNNPEKFSYTKEEVAGLKQSAWLRNMLGLGTSDINDEDFAVALSNTRRNLIEESGGIDIVGKSIKAFKEMQGSKSGIFIDSWDTKALTHAFGKAIHESEDLALLVSKKLTGKADKNFFTNFTNQVKEDVRKKTILPKMGRYGTWGYSTKVPNSSAVRKRADEELIKYIQTDPKAWQIVQEYTTDKAYDYASGRDGSRFAKMAAALYGSKIAYENSKQSKDKGIVALLNNIFPE